MITVLNTLIGHPDQIFVIMTIIFIVIVVVIIVILSIEHRLRPKTRAKHYGLGIKRKLRTICGLLTIVLV